MRKFVFLMFFLLVVLPCGWVLFNVFEQKPPEITTVLPSTYLSRSYEMATNISERGTGLKHIIITITQGERKKILLDKTYPFMGYQALLMGATVQSDALNVPVAFWKYGMVDGEATITVEAWDHAWTGWGRGNCAVTSHKVIIDTRPPRIEVLTKVHNITRGGSGLAIYRLYEPHIKSGVQVGDNFFPGYSGMFQ